MKNWKTTLFGFLAAFIGYFAQAGFVWPTTKQEWLAALYAAFIAAFAVAAKDLNVHSTDQEVATSTRKQIEKDSPK